MEEILLEIQNGIKWEIEEQMFGLSEYENNCLLTIIDEVIGEKIFLIKYGKIIEDIIEDVGLEMFQIHFANNF